MKSFLRFLSRNKIYAMIEAVGLAVSLAFVIIIGSYALGQFSITRESPDRKDIYAVGFNQTLGLSYGFADEMKAKIPEVEMTTEIEYNETLIKLGQESVSTGFMLTDKSFFDMFPYFEFVSGSPEALNSKSEVLVSESFANRYSIKPGDVLDLSGQFTVAGIVKDFGYSVFQSADVILSSESNLFGARTYSLAGIMGSITVLAKVKKGTDFNDFYGKVDNLFKDYYSEYIEDFYSEDDGYGANLELVRFDKVFYYDGIGNLNSGNKILLILLAAVCLMLLVSAIFNYINLNIALVGKRAKEMATRRVVGASKSDVVWRYILESLSFTTVCFVLALVLAEALTPTVNRLLGYPQLPIVIQYNPAGIIFFILLILTVGILSGLLPALFAGSYKPIDVLRGTFRTSSKMTFSKVFIVIQSVFSVFLVAMAFVMEAQHKKSLERPLNVDSADKIYLAYYGKGGVDSGLADAIRELPCVSRVGYSIGAPGRLSWGAQSVTADGRGIFYRMFAMDSTAFSMLGLRIIKDYGTPLYNSVWFSKSAFDASGFTDEYHPIDSLAKNNPNCEQLAGIFEDVPVSSSNSGRDFLIANVVHPQDMHQPGLLIETVGDHSEAKAEIKEVFNKWNKSGSDVYLDYGYLEDFYKEGLEPERDLITLMEMFVALSILISLLGLMAMSAYFADERSRDIAIRKVFGATVDSELRKNVKDYMVLILIACAIAAPLAVFAARMYIMSFTDKITGYVWIIVLAVVFTLVMSFFSVFWQTLKAAQTNPADRLR